ncbi:LamG-like jellyroll fold domain-containing protein [Streptomyces sp. NPDC006733]|uniref:LamG-like jellyroll fold domain-containing protein n=1 Tax=Streptomyces sp. NPDC006733 TaxID=3155460 RepID=UPI0033FE8336
MRRFRRRSPIRLAALFAVSGLVLSLAGPAVADDVPPSVPADTATAPPLTPGGPMQAALLQAKATGKPVVVESLTTPTEQTLAHPDGTLATTNNLQAVRVKKNNTWAAVDATLGRNGDGTYSPAATPAGVALSGGGSGPLATLTDASGHRLALTFPATLPAPTVSGDTALYANVLPGVDLEASVSDQGAFSEVLIVRNATAAANPALKTLRLATSTQGLTLAADAQGRLSATTADGTAAYTSPAPIMWDSSTATTAPAGTKSAAARTAAAAAAEGTTPTASSTDGPGAGAQVQPVALTATAGAVTLTPDAGLLTGATTKYPVFIDPTVSPVSSGTNHFAEAQEGCPSAPQWDTPQKYGGEGIGYQHFSSTCFGLERSFFELNTSNLHSNMVISKSTLVLAEVDGADGGCSNTWPVTLYPTADINTPQFVNKLTWNNQPGVGGALGTQNVASASVNAGCGTRYVNFDVTAGIRGNAAIDKDTWAFSLRGNESKYDTNYGFMRFNSNPYIVTVFDIPPAAPSAPDTDPNSQNPAGAACGGGPDGWIGKTTLAGTNSNITLNAALTTPMSGVNLQAQYAMWDNMLPQANGSATVFNPPLTAAVASGTTVHHNLGFTAQDGHQYGWGVRAWDGTLYGPWTTSCHFKTDLTPPTQAAFTDSADFPPLGSGTAPTKHAGDPDLTIHVTSTDPMPTGPCAPLACVRSDIRKFEWSLDTPIGPTGADAGHIKGAFPDATTGFAQADIPISVTAQQWGTHTLYVQAVDGAGNANPSTYSFYAPWNPATKVTAGDLTGDGIPDLVAPSKGGDLLLLPGNTDAAAAPVISSTAATSPEAEASTGWDKFLITHRGSTAQSGVDDLFAYSTVTHQMYIYRNDAETSTTGAAGHFSNTNGRIPLTEKPTCNPGSTCAGYDTTWGTVSQILAPGSFDNGSGLADLITMEGGRLWYYPGTSKGGVHLKQALLLGSGDWSNTTLIAPGTVDGTPTLWARDNITGTLHTYPLTFDGNGLPTTLLAAPAHHALVSAIAVSGGGTVCADVVKAATANNTKIQIYPCNGSDAQQMTLGTDNTVRVLGKCLDITNGGTASGTGIQLYTCNGTAAQKWTPGPNGTLKNPQSNLCLADPASSTTAGTQLIIYACLTGRADQNWTGSINGTLPAQVPVLPIGLGDSTYPTIASPGDTNNITDGASGGPDGNPDLYATTSNGQILEYPGTAPSAGIAQFATPVPLGYLHQPTDWWKLTNADNTVRPANKLTANSGATFTTDPGRGTVLHLNGTTGDAATAVPVLDTSAGYTVSAWVNMTNTTTYNTAVGQASSSGTGVDSFYLQYSKGYNAWAFISPASDSTSPGTYPGAVASTPPVLNTWTHLVGVYNAATHTMNLYINGNLAGTGTNPTAWNATGPLHIGSAGTSNYFPGNISNVQTFNTALTPAAVAALNHDQPTPTQLS